MYEYSSHIVEEEDKKALKCKNTAKYNKNSLSKFDQKMLYE